eukprot:53473-Amphidinium_carterae.1
MSASAAAPSTSPISVDSPAYSPEMSVQSVSPEVSSSTPTTPRPQADISGLSPIEAFNFLMENIPMNAEDTRKFWSADGLKSIYQQMVSPWSDLIMQHSSVHCLSQGPSESVSEEGLVKVWMHSSLSTMNRMLESGNLGQRYLFYSPMQAALHRMAHAHFALSSATLEDDFTIVMGVQIKESFLLDNAQSCTVGYCKSLSVDLSMEESSLKLSGMVFLNTSLRDFLKSEAGLTLTKRSISQYEAFFHSDTISEYNLLNIESVRGLLLPNSPRASKIRSTLSAQAPEISDMWQELTQEVK